MSLRIHGDSISLGTLMPRKAIPATLGDAGPVIGSKRQLLAEAKLCLFVLSSPCLLDGLNFIFNLMELHWFS